MNKFLKKIFLFAILIIVIYPLTVIMWGEISPKVLPKNLVQRKTSSGHLQTRLNEANTFGPVDILILGSSRAYRHYDPRIFRKYGIEIFNLGSSAQTFIQTNYILQKYAQRFKPEIIVLDIYPAMFGSDGVESSLDLMFSDLVLDPQFRKLTWKQRNLKLFNTLIFSTYKTLIYDQPKQEDLESEEDTYISGGYVEKELRINDLIGSQVINYEIRDFQLKAFSEILEFCKSENIELILIQSPQNQGVEFSNEDAMINFLKNKEIIYYDFSHLPFLDDKQHFYDYLHLNLKGVSKYNEFVIKRIWK